MGFLDNVTIGKSSGGAPTPSSTAPAPSSSGFLGGISIGAKAPAPETPVAPIKTPAVAPITPTAPVKSGSILGSVGSFVSDAVGAIGKGINKVSTAVGDSVIDPTNGGADTDKIGAENPLQRDLTFLPSAVSGNLPFGIGNIFSNLQENPQLSTNVTLGDVAGSVPQAIKDTGVGIAKGLISVPLSLGGIAESSAGLGAKYNGEIAFNIPGLGQVSSAQFQVANKIENGEDPVQATLETGSDAIFNTLFFADLAAKPFATTPTKLAEVKGVNMNDLANSSAAPDGSLDSGDGKTTQTPVQPVKVGARTGRLYEAPTATNVLPSNVVERMQSQGIDLGKNYDASKPTFFRVSQQPSGQIVGEVLQIKPSFVSQVIDAMSSAKSKGASASEAADSAINGLPENGTTSLHSQTVDPAVAAESVKNPSIKVTALSATESHNVNEAATRLENGTPASAVVHELSQKVPIAKAQAIVTHAQAVAEVKTAAQQPTADATTAPAENAAPTAQNGEQPIPSTELPNTATISNNPNENVLDKTPAQYQTEFSNTDKVQAQTLGAAQAKVDSLQSEIKSSAPQSVEKAQAKVQLSQAKNELSTLQSQQTERSTANRANFDTKVGEHLRSQGVPEANVPRATAEVAEHVHSPEMHAEHVNTSIREITERVAKDHMELQAKDSIKLDNGDTVPAERQEAADRDWAEHYADDAGTRSDEIQRLKQEIKDAKAAQKPALQKKLTALEKKDAKIENDFLEKWQKPTAPKGKKTRKIAERAEKESGYHALVMGGKIKGETQPAAFHSVEGDKVDLGVPGDFFVHHAIHLDEGKIVYEKGWVVTEGRSGMTVDLGSKTRTGAINSAKEKLAGMKSGLLEDTIKKQTEKFGVSPRYAVAKSSLVPADKTFYHGTLSDFKNFDENKLGANTGFENAKFGFFFLDDAGRAKEFTDTSREAGDDRVAQVKSVHLNIKNPLDLTNEGIFSNESQAPTVVELLGGKAGMKPAAALKYLNDNIGLGEIGDMQDELYGDIKNRAIMERDGYDGIVSTFGKDAGKEIKEYVAFHANQVEDVSTGTPSKSSVGIKEPGAGISLPSLSSKTLTPEGDSSIRYTSPKYVTVLDRVDESIPSYTTTAIEFAKSNVKPFQQDIEKALGVTPEMDVKSPKSIQDKAERMIAKGTPLARMNDVLRGRVVVPESEREAKFDAIKKNFEIVGSGDYRTKESEMGYRGINVTVRLPNGMPAEIQIHSPESLAQSNFAHGIYGKYRNKDVTQFTPEELAEYNKDKQSARDFTTKKPETSTDTFQKKPLSPEKTPEHNMFEKAYQMHTQEDFEKVSNSVERVGKDLAEAEKLKKQIASFPRIRAQRTAEQNSVAYRYSVLSNKRNTDFYNYWTGKSLRDESKTRLDELGEQTERGKTSYRKTYVDTVKKLISSGYDVPKEMVDQFPEFKAAVNARARYEKGWNTSFANKSTAIDESTVAKYGFKVKNQDGTPISDASIKHITDAATDIGKAIGSVKDIAQAENLTIAHTQGKYPFLRGDAGGLYQGGEKTITVGVGSQKSLGHEMFHAIDHASGTMSVRQSKHYATGGKYDEALISSATQNMNGSRYSIDKAIKLNPKADAEEKQKAKDLRTRLTEYYRVDSEVMARLAEQYMATKLGKNEATEVPEYYYDTPGYWDKETFDGMKDQVGNAIQSKLDQARTKLGLPIPEVDPRANLDLPEDEKTPEPTAPASRPVAEAQAELENMQQQESFLREAVSEHPGKDLVKYQSSVTGELPEISRYATSKFGKKGDVMLQDILGQDYSGNGDIDVGNEKLAAYRALKSQLDDTSAYVKELKNEVKTGVRSRSLPPRGFINPGVIIDDTIAKTKEVSDFVKATQRHVQLSGDLAHDLYKLQGANQADLQAVEKIAKEVKISTEDNEALYHHAENALNPNDPVKLTENQQALYEKYEKPLADANQQLAANIEKAGIGIDPLGYIHREVKGRSTPLDKLLNPEKASEARLSTGGLLTQSDSSFKHRTMKVLEDAEGNRRVVSIKNSSFTIPKGKREGDVIRSKRVTGFTPSKGRDDLGTFNLKSKASLLENEIKPVQTKINKLQVALDAVSKLKVNEPLSKGAVERLAEEMWSTITGFDRDFANGRFDTIAETKPTIKKIQGQVIKFRALKTVKPTERLTNQAKIISSLQDGMRELVNQMADIEAKYNPEELNNKVFTDKNGKQYSIKDATTREIEAATNLEYHHNALASRIVQYLKLNRINRAIQFIEDWKAQPSFSEISSEFPVKPGQKPAPANWKGTSMPQFRGYLFEPRTAEVLDDFYGAIQSSDAPTDKLLHSMAKFLVNTIFYNPIAHPLNVTVNWLTDSGANFLNPKEWNADISSFAKAYTAITTKNDDYVYALQNAAPLMNSSVDPKDVAKMLFNNLSSQIDQNTDVSSPLAKALNIENVFKMKDLIGKAYHNATWIPNDILALQAIYRRMAAKGMTFEDAVKDSSRFIPDYHTPSRVLGSRKAATVLKSGNDALFAAPYHYGIIKSLVSITKDIAAPEEGQFTKEGNARRTSALGKALMLAFIAAVVYPELDKLLRKGTGNNLSYITPSGNAKLVTDVYQTAIGQKSPSQLIQGIATLQPGIQGLLELLVNRDFYTGNQIYGKPPAIGLTAFGESLVSPLQVASQDSLSDFALSFFNIHTPKTAPGKVALEAQIYDEKPTLAKTVEKEYAQGDQAQALSQMREFNQRLVTNTQAARLQEGKAPLTQDEINTQLLKPFGIKVPGVKAMANANQLYGDNSTTTKSSLLNTVVTYAKAIGTDPATAFNRIFSGQQILRVDNAGLFSKDSAIVVQRLPLAASEEVRSQDQQAEGLSNSAMKGMQLDHVIALELGGTNDVSNLNLVTTNQNEVLHPVVENFLSSALQKGEVSRDNVQQYILDYKAGALGETLPTALEQQWKDNGSKSMTAQQIMDLVNSGKAK